MNASLLAMEDALAQLLAAARPLAKVEDVPAAAALGRILARPLVSAIAVPPLDNSAMDGYALRCADVTALPARLPVTLRVPAGAARGELPPGSAARIFTGAPLPLGADAVVMQEDCEAAGDRVTLRRQPEAGDNIRRAGDDIATGATVLTAGTRLGPAELGVAASVGAVSLPVWRRLRVALLCTGDELALPGEPLAPGQIYNSNRATLLALLAGLGCEVRDLGRVADTLPATRAALAEAAQNADLVLSSGGVSVGEEDHVKAALAELGRLDLWRIAMKPGKPLAFGRIGDTDFIGLPGNPVSAFVTFCLFARPFILRRMGAVVTAPAGYPVRAAFDRAKPGKVREFVRVRIARRDDGSVWAEAFANQSSGVLTSLAWADGLAEIPAGATFTAGETLRFVPLAELLQ